MFSFSLLYLGEEYTLTRFNTKSIVPPNMGARGLGFTVIEGLQLLMPQRFVDDPKCSGFGELW